MKKILLNIISILLLIILLVTFFAWKQNNLKNALKNHTPLTEHININNQPYIGNPNAPVTIIEFFDSKCPTCFTWEQTILPKLMKKYVDTNKARIVFISYPLIKDLGKDSYLGSLSLESVYAQGSNTAYYQLYQALYKRQESPVENWVTLKLITSLAEKIKGINVNKLKTDIQTNKYKYLVDRNISLANKYRIDGTPTVFINDKRVESLTGSWLNEKIAENPLDLGWIESMINSDLHNK